MHNIKHTCPPIANYVRNCYNVPPRLFVLSGKEVLHEGTAQVYPTALAIYVIALIPLFKYLATCYSERDPKMVAFADNLTSSGRLSKLRSWVKFLLDISPKYGSFPKPSKTILIVKREYESKAAEIFDDTNIKINQVDRGT